MTVCRNDGGAGVSDWLDKLGMAEYAQRFAENDIDFTILADLTDQDLKDLGVASLGHRRKLLRAIAAFGEPPEMGPPGAPTASEYAPAPIPPELLTALQPREAAGERRYLTVLFCDLVGSTAIAAQLDAEEWRDLVGDYLETTSAAIAEMGGHVARKVGDGILALFGYPVAHENDAERAARAALSIQRALNELNRRNATSGKPDLKARIGLDTGPAVLDAAGEIYGDVANVAARVEAQAEPGVVLVTGRVQRQIAGLFVAEARGTRRLKGVAEPTALFKLVRESGGGRHARRRQLTPFVGRDDEIAMLLRRWHRARQGNGQFVLIVGEPGIGKSRLIEEFQTRLRDTPHISVEWNCSQLLQNTPLHPIAEWGRARFGNADVPADRRLADLESSLMQVKLDPAEIVPLVAPILDIPVAKERTPAIAGEEMRRQQLAALTNWVMAGARAQPLVLVFEDLHWADPSTFDVLRNVAEQAALAPLFVVATTRPEFRPSWPMRSHHGTISLAPLGRAQVHDMVAELSARPALPKDLIEEVASRTGGVPLFIEEVTRLLLERGEQGGVQVIPPTLQQSLMARLDQLGSAREVAQIGSVIGRSFSYKLLRDVAGMDDAPLHAALDKLANADIVLVQGLRPDSDYRFKHALIQDAAYENLLKSRRQVLHRRVAEILRDRFANMAAAEPEVLAHHFTQAGVTDKAIEWWGKAGDQALRRSAFKEAIAHLSKAIEMAEKAEEGVARTTVAATTISASERLKLQTSLGQALIWEKGWGAAETKAAFERARELAPGIENQTERFRTYYGHWGANMLRGDLRAARDVAEIFLGEIDTSAPTLEGVVARRTLGITCFCQGDVMTGHALLDEAVKIYEPERDRAARSLFGLDAGITAMACLAYTSWLTGDVARARKLIAAAEKSALDADHVQTLVQVMTYTTGLHVVWGDAASALRGAEIVGELAQKHGMQLHSTYAAMFRGWARTRLHHFEAGLAEFRQGLATYVSHGNTYFLPTLQGRMAEIEAEGEDVAAALSRVGDALALADATGEHLADSFLHRIHGEILLKCDPPDVAQAEEAFLTAIAVAQQQKAKRFEPHAVLSLAKLYQSIGRTADGHAVLASALARFAPTPELPEIAEAEALLAGLK